MIISNELTSNIKTPRSLDTKDPIKNIRNRFHFPFNNNGKPFIFTYGETETINTKLDNY